MLRIVEVATPRLVISAPQGKSGKTIATLAIELALIKRGLRVQPFKIGPDFIDPTYHTAITHRPCRNLDMYLHGPEKILERFAQYAQDADIAVIEGVFGLYDSVDGVSEFGSTSQIAKILKAPVVVVVNAERATTSIAAVLRGLAEFDARTRIRGVVLTNVASERQFKKIARAVEAYCRNVEVVGYIKRSREIAEAFAYRHLGLVPVPERERNLLAVLEKCAKIDVDKVVEIAREAEPLRVLMMQEPEPKHNVSVGLIVGRAFTFYYPELLERCLAYASRVVLVDPEVDAELPQVDLLIIGGGFPEELAEELEKNRPLRYSIKKFAEKGGVIYAECGGLMYLTETILTLRNEEYEMCGIFNAYTVMLSRPVGHGYVYAEVIADCPPFRKGILLRGHEFHHSKIILRDSEVKLCLRLLRGRGIGDGRDGLLKWRTYAQYMHVHPDTYDVVRVLIMNVLSSKCQDK